MQGEGSWGCTYHSQKQAPVFLLVACSESPNAPLLATVEVNWPIPDHILDLTFCAPLGMFHMLPA